MPRGPRLDYPGALHHVICRGIERRTIFRSDRDRAAFLDRLAALVQEANAGLYAWALMPNHAHVLLRTGRLPLSRLAQRWLGPYATNAVLLGKATLAAQDCAFVLRRFAPNVRQARIAYRKFVREGMLDGSSPDLEGGGLATQLPRLGAHSPPRAGT